MSDEGEPKAHVSRCPGLDKTEFTKEEIDVILEFMEDCDRNPKPPSFRATLLSYRPIANHDIPLSALIQLPV